METEIWLRHFQIPEIFHSIFTSKASGCEIGQIILIRRLKNKNADLGLAWLHSYPGADPDSTNYHHKPL